MEIPPNWERCLWRAKDLPSVEETGQKVSEKKYTKESRPYRTRHPNLTVVAKRGFLRTTRAGVLKNCSRGGRSQSIKLLSNCALRSLTQIAVNGRGDLSIKGGVLVFLCRVAGDLKGFYFLQKKVSRDS